MVWQMDILTIDVGQGESSIIDIQDIPPGGGPPTTRRTVLIDGGLAGYADIVHQHVRAVNPQGVDFILVSHYDGDHSEGVTNLLAADNLWHFCEAICAVAAPYAIVPGQNRAQIIAATTAAASAAAWGAWGPNAGLEAPVVAAALATPMLAGMTDVQAANAGAAAVTAHGAFGVASLVAPTRTRNIAVKLAARVAATMVAFLPPPATLPAVQAAMRTSLQQSWRGFVPARATVDTGGIYRTTEVIDIGNRVAPDPAYVPSVNGQVNVATVLTAAPLVNRQRTSIPLLGTELLWRAGAPANAATAPVALVVSTPLTGVVLPVGSAWQGQGVAGAHVASGQADNDVSIGLLFRFNEFTYFTAGDLPFHGENVIGASLLAHPVPDATGVAGNNFPVPPPPPFGAFKVGHHGGSTSTIGTFPGAVQPAAALLSSGTGYGHPTQLVINALYAQPTIAHFYLTNCLYPRVDVPASNGVAPQQTAMVMGGAALNRSRISGDNGPVNNAMLRARGDITLHVDEPGSTVMPGPRQFTVTYWDQNPPVGGANWVNETTVW
jgi:hypothetical protein